MAKKTSKNSNLTFELFKNFLAENKFLAASFSLGLILLVLGFYQLLTSNSSNSSEIEILPATQESQKSSESQIVVDVAGAIAKPGVYTLAADSRVAQAIEAAGNFTSKADLGWVSKNLNLAAKLQDGAKIYILSKGEQGSVNVQGSQQFSNTAKVNINSSNQSQLEALPAVGPVTATKIINGRPYNSVEELLTKKIVGKATFEKIKDLISVF